MRSTTWLIGWKGTEPYRSCYGVAGMEPIKTKHQREQLPKGYIPNDGFTAAVWAWKAPDGGGS